MKRTLIFNLFCCISFASIGQYKPGDTLNSELWKYINNYDDSIAHAKRNKDKAILLDFWGMYCGTCISSMPKMKEIQEGFADRLQIVYVQPHDPAELLKFFERRKDLGDYRLPMVKLSSELDRAFPRLGIPHVVWINSDRTIQAITNGSAQVTTENVSKWLDSGGIRFAYTPIMTDYDYNKSLLGNLNVHEVPLKRYSLISEGVASVPVTFKIENKFGKYRRLVVNQHPLINIYRWIAASAFGIRENEFTFRVRTDRYFDSICRNNEQVFYEYIEGNSIGDSRDWVWNIVSDLDAKFGLTCRISETEMTSYYLSMPASNDDTSYYEETLNEVIIKNMPIGNIAKTLQVYFKPGRMLVTRGYDNQHGSITFSKSKTSEADLFELMRISGARLIPIQQTVRVLDIRKSE